MTPLSDQSDEVLSGCTSVTSRRSIGSPSIEAIWGRARSFEWIEAELHRKEREAGFAPSGDGPDPRLVHPDGETPAQRQALRHKRHMERHGPDFHELFEELDPAERLIMMGLEKEIRLQRERTTFKGRKRGPKTCNRREKGRQGTFSLSIGCGGPERGWPTGAAGGLATQIYSIVK